eukprot:GEMP01006767.1.p1 GENE.GEMP01006767.1~~GEMP01006767.1.p1  ORF type:complete len:862 (+),score=142.82 GEMP01006767.1:101-2686(+)
MGACVAALFASQESFFYNPYSRSLTDHYKVGRVLERGSFGVIRAGRLCIERFYISPALVMERDVKTDMSISDNPDAPNKPRVDVIGKSSQGQRSNRSNFTSYASSSTSDSGSSRLSLISIFSRLPKVTGSRSSSIVPESMVGTSGSNASDEPRQLSRVTAPPSCVFEELRKSRRSSSLGVLAGSTTYRQRAQSVHPLVVTPDTKMAPGRRSTRAQSLCTIHSRRNYDSIVSAGGSHVLAPARCTPTQHSSHLNDNSEHGGRGDTRSCAPGPLKSVYWQDDIAQDESRKSSMISRLSALTQKAMSINPRSRDSEGAREATRSRNSSQMSVHMPSVRTTSLPDETREDTREMISRLSNASRVSSFKSAFAKKRKSIESEDTGEVSVGSTNSFASCFTSNGTMRSPEVLDEARDQMRLSTASRMSLMHSKSVRKSNVDSGDTGETTRVSSHGRLFHALNNKRNSKDSDTSLITIGSMAERPSCYSSVSQSRRKVGHGKESQRSMVSECSISPLAQLTSFCNGLKSRPNVHDMLRRKRHMSTLDTSGGDGWPFAIKLLRKRLMTPKWTWRRRLQGCIARFMRVILPADTTFAGLNRSVHDQLSDTQRAFEMEGAEMEKEQMIKGELILLAASQHDHVMKLVEAFEDNNMVYVVLARCYGDVSSRYCTEPPPKSLLAKFAFQLCSAVAHVHSLGIMHRDIKLEQLLFKNPHQDSDICLADFGLAAQVGHGFMRQIAGSPGFLPPEIWMHGEQSIKSDIWACGVSIYMMWTCRLPFSFTTHSAGDCDYLPNDRKTFCEEAFGLGARGWELANIVCNPDLHPDYSEISAPHAVNLVKWLLVRTQADRLTLRKALWNPWIRDGLQVYSS